MYAQFFGLKQTPFSIAPDPRYLFMSERHREALAHLLYGVGGGGGFVVLTGEIGAGKTTVCRCFLEQIPRRCNVAYIFNPKLTVAELLKSVCDEFRIPYEHQGTGQATIKDYVDPLNEYLLKTHAVGQNNVLIIDEAQNLSSEVLEQLRLLTNLETSERKLLQIMLIGQPELRTMLARPELAQLAQRVIAHFHLEALSEDETGQYIQHRLSVAGLNRGKLFDNKAVRRIHQLTHGVPRRINLLFDRALLGAYAESKNRVDKTIVEKASHEVFQTLEPLDAPTSRAVSAPKHRFKLTWPPLAAGAMVFLMSGLLVAVGAWLFQRHYAPLKIATKQATVTAPAAAASMVDSPASKAANTTAPVPVDAHQITQSAYRQEKDALRALATLWQVTLNEGDTCQLAAQQQLACFRNSGGLSQIKQLERPVVLSLHDDRETPMYALLTGLQGQSAILQIESHRYALPLSALATMWRGDFTTFWHTPPTYRGKILPGNTGPTVDWLATQMARINHEPAPITSGKQVFGPPMQAKVYAFQISQGLKPDGVVGATTFMQINRAIGVHEPILLTGQAAAR